MPGDEVITTPFTFIATATAIVRLGAKPVFADIDPVTFNIDPKEIKKKITRKTRGIIAVHLYGNPCQMDEITRLAKKHKLFVIEDCAQSCGSMFKGKKVGTFGHVGAFSFYPTKTLGASGDAGAITTNDKKLYEKLKSLRHHGDNGSHHSYQHPHIGINSRLDEIQAAVLNSKLKHLPKWNKKRRKIAMAYIQSLKSHGLSNVILPSETPGGKSVFHQFTLRVLKGKRNGLMNYLRTNRIFSSIFYPIPLHLQPCFRRFGYKKGNFKQAEQASQEVVSLPIYPQLLNKAQRNIVSCISSYLS